MGQKAHPYGLRLGYIKDWKSRWFARRGIGPVLHEDLRIRKFLKGRLRIAGVSDIIIERSVGKVRVWIYTARPGIVIGRGGQEINQIREDVSHLTRDEVLLDIKEIKVPQVDAQLVAENVAIQLEKRVAFRKAMKKSVSSALAKGALGIKIQCKGRLGGSEIARSEGYKEGKVPLSTFRADVAYGFAEAFTTYGTIGVKVWIYHGDVLVKQEEAKRAKELEEKHFEMARAKQGRSARKLRAEKTVSAITETVETEAPVQSETETPASEAESKGSSQDSEASKESKQIEE